MSLDRWQLGGFTLTRAGWAGPLAVYLDFVAEASGFFYQLYANRSLIGSTDSPGERRIVGLVPPSEIPAPLTVIRVAPSQLLTDFGPELPPVPWNRFRLRWSAGGFPPDSDHFDIDVAPAPSSPFDPELVVARVPFIGNGEYQFELPPIAGSGLWQYAVVPRDNAKPLGNAGTAAVVNILALVPPPDVAQDDDGHRFTVSAAGGVLTAAFEYGPNL